MQFTLINAAIATDFENVDEATAREVRAHSTAPPLGVLSLASVLERCGIRPVLVNLDELYYAYLREFGSDELADFPSWVAPIVVSSGTGLYGFSSICSSYPLTIRIAECVKREQPDCTILLGGPQASVVDLQTLAAFPFVDFILRGEAEQTLPTFLEQWTGNRRLSTIPGLTYRSAFGPIRNEDAAVIEDLDSLPLPAYHLTNYLKNASYASLELGRGCPFACTFCSTNDFFRRRFRLKSPARVLSEMRAIASGYGISSFELVHDMFTVDRRRVTAFCRHMLESKENFGWSCSARTDCVDEELLTLMAAAGCTGIFFGIETGSKRMQRTIDKDLDPVRAKVIIETAERLGIPTTVSLITGFPDENCDDLEETISMYMHSLRHARSSPQLNLLAPLAGTQIYSRYKEQMALAELCSDMSHQGRTQNESDRELIRKYPHIFPNFYLLPTPGLDRAFCLELREFLRMATVRLRWLLTALHQAGPGILDLFSEWRKHRIGLRPDLRGGSLRHYYTLKCSANEFAEFVRKRMPTCPDLAVEALLDCYEAMIEAEARDAALPRMQVASGCLLPNDFPVRMQHVHVLELEFDIQRIINCLSCGGRPARARRRKFYRTAKTENGASRLVEITRLVAKALQACDGRHTVKQFVSGLADSFAGSEDERRHAAEWLLEAIHKKGFIEIYRSTSRADGSHAGEGTNREYSSTSAAASEQNHFSIQAQ